MLARLFLCVLLLAPQFARADAFSSVAPGGSGSSITATGASVPRSAAQIAADAVNVLGYAGIDPTGVADSSAAVNAAIGVACGFNPPKEVYFPPGTYLITAANISPCSGLTMRASPGSATVKAGTGNVNGVLLLSIASVHNVTVYGLTFDGGGTSFANTGNVLQVFNASTVVFDHITVQNTRGIGLLMSTNLVNDGVRDSVFTNVGNYWTVSQLTADRRQGIALCCTTTATFNGTISGTTLTVNSGLSGSILAGQIVTGVGVPANETIVSGSGTSWVVSISASVGPEAMTATRPAADNHGNFVTGSYFSNIGLDAISATQQKAFAANDNRFDLANGEITATWTNPQPIDFGACIYGAGGDLEFSAVGNVCNGAQGNGIDVAAGGATISGNYITGSGEGGIGVFNPGLVSTTTINGNNIVNSGQWSSSPWQGGIAMSGTYGVVSVSGNTSSDIQTTKTQNYGLQMQTGSTWTELRIDPSNAFLGNKISSFGGMLIGYGTGGTADNRVRNPCGAIDQNKEGGSYAAGGGNTMTLDGFITTQSAGGIAVARGSAFAPPGCTTALHVSLTTTKTAASTDFYQIEQNIEGVDLQDLNWGTANAKPVVVDFCAKPSVSGTFSFVLRNNNGPRYYATTYAATAGTQTCQSIVIPGDVVTPIVNNTSAQLEMIWDFGSGTTNLTSTTGAWTAGGPAGVAGETLFVGGTPGDTFDISAIRLYAGQADVPWIPRSMADELAKVRRYYQKSFSVGTAVAQSAGATGSIGLTAPYAQATFGTVSMPLAFSPMRAAPTVVFYSPSAASANCYDTTRTADAGAAAASNIGTNSLTATCTLAATDALGDLLNVHFTLDARI